MSKTKYTFLFFPILKSLFYFWLTLLVGFSVVVYLKLFAVNDLMNLSNTSLGILNFSILIIATLIFAISWLIYSFNSRALVFAREFAAEIEDERAKNAHLLRLSSLGEMAAGIAHEINNPLTVIVGKTRLLHKEIEKENFDKEKMRDALLKLETNTTRITKIIETMKSVSRDSGRDQFEPNSIVEIVQTSFEFVKPRLAEKEIEFTSEIKTENVLIYCKPSEISQVLINMFSNSIDALEKIKDKKIKILINADEIFLSLYFIDSGAPMPLEISEKIMSPFFTTKEIGKGTGLGLSISKSIMEKHGGELLLDRDFPTTTFVLKFPITKNGYLNN